MAKCVHPKTAGKIRNRSFSMLAWNGLYLYEADSSSILDYFSVQPIKHIQQMKCLLLPKLSSESVTNQLSQTKHKLLEKVC